MNSQPHFQEQRSKQERLLAAEKLMRKSMIDFYGILSGDDEEFKKGPI